MWGTTTTEHSGTIDLLSGWLTDWLTDWLIDWLTGWLTDRTYVWSRNESNGQPLQSGLAIAILAPRVVPDLSRVASSFSGHLPPGPIHGLRPASFCAFTTFSTPRKPETESAHSPPLAHLSRPLGRTDRLVSLAPVGVRGRGAAGATPQKKKTKYFQLSS